MRAVTIFILFIFTSLLGLVNCANIGIGENKNDLLKAREFLSYLLVRDEEEIIKYMGRPKTFSKGGKINQDIVVFLYENSANGEGWKSVIEIAEIDDIYIKVIEQESDVVTVLYYPEKYSQKMQDLKFLENEWMKKYFACEFTKVNSEWQFYLNVCFAETDGPYPSE